MAEYRYVVVRSDGWTYDLSRNLSQKDLLKQDMHDLQSLLADGWVPLRETGMGGGGQVAWTSALVVLSK
jgi:hypothetical protein